VSLVPCDNESRVVLFLFNKKKCLVVPGLQIISNKRDVITNYFKQEESRVAYEHDAQAKK
jgi:hypothetical protein